MAVTPVQSGNPGLMRSMNERAALALLIARGPMTRVRLGEAAGLSGPTTSQLVKRLSEAGLVTEAGHTKGSRGPNAAIYRACTESALGVALHVRIAHIAAQVVDAEDRAYPAVEMTPAADGHDAWATVADAIAAACDAAQCAAGSIAAICVGGPGAVSADGDVLRYAEDMPGWPSRAVRSQLEEQLGVSVLIENDANLAAVAEAHVRGDNKDFAFLWQGEGLGVAVMANGQIYRGATGGAGEIGYLPAPRTAAGLDADASDMQGLAGSEAVTRVAQALQPSIETFDDALQALREGELRIPMLAELAPRTAQALVPVIAMLDPDYIVLGGPTGSAFGLEGAGLVEAYLRHETRWCTPVVDAIASNDPVLRGAAKRLSEYLAERLLSRVV